MPEIQAISGLFDGETGNDATITTVGPKHRGTDFNDDCAAPASGDGSHLESVSDAVLKRIPLRSNLPEACRGFKDK